MIEIDGSHGEGGGQMLRTALSLSCITGRPFRIRNIRRNRNKPGLMRQHLVAVQAAARIAAAEVSGGELGSTELVFLPVRVSSGRYNFDIGTAGSAPLVLQTLIPPLLASGGASQVTVVGGTHVPFSPSWHYLEEVFGPTLERLGARIEFVIEACGFYPKGGGKVRCRIQPAPSLSPLMAQERGRLLYIKGSSAVGNLPRGIAERQAQAARACLQAELGKEVPIDIDVSEVTIFGQGTFIFLKAQYEHAVAGFTALGERGKPAERVGEEAARELLEHHASGMPVDPHLADQLVLYLAQAQGHSEYATSRITNHLETNLMVTGLFLEMESKLYGEHDRPGVVSIWPKEAG